MEFGVSVPHGKPGLHTDYGMIREAALECERLGFDSIYLSDHVVPRPNTPYPERDEYDLDAPIRDYLPEFRVVDEEASEGATMRHLFTHTAAW